jgi:hypothetical protein
MLALGFSVISLERFCSTFFGQKRKRKRIERKIVNSLFFWPDFFTYGNRNVNIYAFSLRRKQFFYVKVLRMENMEFAIFPLIRLRLFSKDVLRNLSIILLGKPRKKQVRAKLFRTKFSSE